MESMNKRSLKVVYGDCTLGVSGEGFSYIFSYVAGGMESLVKDGIEWLYRCPKPTFWRAVTDNERGSGFHLKSGSWLTADMFIHCTEKRVIVDGKDLGLPCAPENNRFSSKEVANKVQVIFTYETITCPKTTVDVAYTVDTNGEILVESRYYGKEGLPELPVFGLRIIMPTLAEEYQYEGLSGETYPDRKAGAQKGIYREKPHMVPHLVPQECGMHMDTEWLAVFRNTTLDNSNKNSREHLLKIHSKQEKFHFSCLPYTACEIENATHQEELPPARRTVLCIYGAVRGVGGINSWGADVEEKYHVSAQKDIKFSFVIC